MNSEESRTKIAMVESLKNLLVAHATDAKHECVGFHSRTGRVMTFIAVHNILDEQHVQNM